MINTFDYEEKDISLDFAKYWHVFLFNIYRIFFIVLSGFLLWLLFYINAARIYEVESLLQVSNNSYLSAPYQELMLGDTNSLRLDEQIPLYKSRSNQKKLIDELQLNIYIGEDSQTLPNKKSVLINQFDYDLEDGEIANQFFVKKVSNGYSLFDADKNILLNAAKYNTGYVIDKLKFDIREINFDSDEFISLIYYDPQYIITNVVSPGLNLSKVLESNSPFIEGTLLRVSYVSNDIDLAKKIIDLSNEIFLDESIRKNVKEAKQAINYIDSQINTINIKLKEDESKYNLFKQQNLSLNIEAETESYLSQLEKLIEQISSIDLKISEYQSIYKTDNPLLKRLFSQRKVVENQINNLNKKIESLPKIQQEFINLYRDVEIGQKVYEQLLNSKMEFSLIEASTIGNVDIIDEAYVTRRVSPNLFASLFFAIMLSSLISIIYIMIRQKFFVPIQVPSDITDSLQSIKLIGVIDNLEDRDGEYYKNETLTSLCTNINLILDDKKEANVIEFIGPTAGVGKSTMSMVSAMVFASIGKKVLLIDYDQKRGDIHKNLGLHRLRDNIYNKADINFEDFKVDNNFYFIPSIKNYSDKALLLLESNDFNKFIDNAKNNFDIIIIDTPPALSLPEALSIARFADLIVPVVHHNKSKLNDLRFLLKEFSLTDFDINYLIYNNFEKPKGYYGYDYYAYKYYGNYDYRYEKDE